MRKLLIFLVIVITISVSVAWIWWQYYFPFNEFARMGDIHFTPNTRVLEWHNEGWGYKGKFQIPENEINDFVMSNEFSAGNVHSEFELADRCIHEGDNSVKMYFNKTTGIAEISIQGPDHSGDKPCSVKK